MRLVYHNRHPHPDAPAWAEYFPQERLEEMLGLADVLSVHVPLRKETEGLVGAKIIRGLKKGAILVNTARGKVVDEEALIRALEDGHLSSAALDVYPDEPAANRRLLEFPQNVLLPHAGTETRDSQRKMEVRALTTVRDFFTKGQGADRVAEMSLSAFYVHRRCLNGGLRMGCCRNDPSTFLKHGAPARGVKLVREKVAMQPASASIFAKVGQDASVGFTLRVSDASVWGVHVEQEGSLLQCLALSS